MELTFAQQSQAFLWSIVLGTALGLIYGIIKFFRAALKAGRAATIAADILFMLIAAFSLFLFSLGFIQGYVRIYVAFGAALGFFLYRISVGRAISAIYKPILGFVYRIFDKISSKIKIIIKKLLKIACGVLYNNSGKKDLKDKRETT